VDNSLKSPFEAALPLKGELSGLSPRGKGSPRPWLPKVLHQAQKKAHKVPHVPLRTCLVCRTKKPSLELFPVDLNESGELRALTAKGKASLGVPCGKGAWVCRVGDCLSNLSSKAAKAKFLRNQGTLGRRKRK
jgi:predicted RNA-binding protein YlxR (DUF448 family)